MENANIFLLIIRKFSRARENVLPADGVHWTWQSHKLDRVDFVVI